MGYSLPAVRDYKSSYLQICLKILQSRMGWWDKGISGLTGRTTNGSWCDGNIKVDGTMAGMESWKRLEKTDVSANCETAAVSKLTFCISNIYKFLFRIHVRYKVFIVRIVLKSKLLDYDLTRISWIFEKRERTFQYGKFLITLYTGY